MGGGTAGAGDDLLEIGLVHSGQGGLLTELRGKAADDNLRLIVAVLQVRLPSAAGPSGQLPPHNVHLGKLHISLHLQKQRWPCREVRPPSVAHPDVAVYPPSCQKQVGATIARLPAPFLMVATG